MKTKTIHILRKSMVRHQLNGNSYFCGTITLNCEADTEKTVLMPVQYGYGSQ